MSGKVSILETGEEHRQAAIDTNGLCCFNHIIGEPLKYEQPNKLYSFQTDIMIPAYEKYDAIWILKATGLGLSEITPCNKYFYHNTSTLAKYVKWVLLLHPKPIF